MTRLIPFLFERISSLVGFYIKLKRNSRAVGSRDTWLSHGGNWPPKERNSSVSRARGAKTSSYPRRVILLQEERRIRDRAYERARGGSDGLEEIEGRISSKTVANTEILLPFSSAPNYPCLYAFEACLWKSSARYSRMSAEFRLRITLYYNFFLCICFFLSIINCSHNQVLAINSILL